VVGATRRAPPSCRGLTKHQRDDARRHNTTGAWTWEQATWRSTPCAWLTENHVTRHVPTTWPRSASRKVAPRRTTTEGWPPGGDRQSRVRAGLSLLLGLPAGPVARPGRRPPAAPWSCEMNAGATSPWHLLRAGATALRLRRGSALRVPACAPGPAPAIWATQVAYVVHPGCLTAVSSASECHPAIRTG